MKKAIFVMITFVALLCGMTSLHAMDLLSGEGVKCTYTHYDMWKGKTGSEGMLFLGMFWDNERIYIVWGKNRNDLVQKEEFSLARVEKEKETRTPVPPPWYQEFTDMLKKAVEWDLAVNADSLEDIHRPIALGWAYHKLKKGSSGWISKTWGPDGKYELIEIGISEIPKLLGLFEGVPDMAKKMREDSRNIKEEADRKKSDEKARKDKVDSLLR